MNETLGWVIGFYALAALFVGYIAGEVIGYSRGLHYSCRIWEKSYNNLVNAIIASQPTKGKEGE